MNDYSCSRRQFLARAAAITAGCAGCGLAGCGSAPSAHHLLRPGSSRRLELPLDEYPALRSLGGAAVTGDGITRPRLVLVRLSETEVAALSPTCPHQGCIVSFTGDTGGNSFVCPCHNSTFGASGDLRRGPATRGLTRYPSVLKEDRVEVTL
jgi:cytochrome b6-f complex iron-sulfur subunit